MTATVSMDDLKTCFYSPAKRTTVDAIHPHTGRGVWGGQTLEEVRAEYPDALVITFEEASERQEADARTAPEEITQERFFYLLEVLPPCRWARDGHAESFHLSEHTTGRVSCIAVRVGKRFFSFQDVVTLTHTERVARVREAFPDLG